MGISSVHEFNGAFPPAPEIEADLEIVLRNSALPADLLSEDGHILYANQAELELLGYWREDYIGRHIAEFHADPQFADTLVDRLQRNETLKNEPARLVARDGSIKHVLISSDLRRLPNRSAQTVCFTTDVTALIEAREKSAKAENHKHQILDALPGAIYTTDAEGRITYYNEAAARYAGRYPAIGEHWFEVWKFYKADGSPLAFEDHALAIALKENRIVRNAEALAEQADGSRSWFAPHITLLRNEDGAVTGAINLMVDITHRKEAEQQQKLMIDELNHRVRNSLTTVLSLINQSAADVRDIAEFRQIIEGRILAMGRVHSQLSRRHWMDAELRELVQSNLSDYMRQGCVAVDGEDINLPPRYALLISMVIHELASNAARHGALSAPGGKVTLVWSAKRSGAAQRLQLVWIERGGPPASKDKCGFGMRLLERGIKAELNGDAVLDFAPTGLRCGIEVPLHHAVG